MKKAVALALLGLRDDEITDARVNEAYRAAMQMNHPDRYANDERLRKHAEEQCKLINEARRILLSHNWEKDESSYKREYRHENDGRPRETSSDENVSDSSCKQDDIHDDEVVHEEKIADSPAVRQRSRKSPRAFWDCHKKPIIGICVVAFLIIAWMIPAEIPVANKAISDLRERGQAISLTYLGSTGPNQAGFQVNGDPYDVTMSAKVILPDGVKHGMTGYVGTSYGEIVLDGSHEGTYEFLFPRQGNLLQSLLTRLGIWNCNPPVKGHPERLGDIVFADKETGFSAAFPKQSETSSETRDISPYGKVKVSIFNAGGGSDYTEVAAISSKSFAQAVGESSKSQIYENIAQIVNDSFMSYSEILIPAEDSWSPTYTDLQGNPCVTAVEPFIPLSSEGSQGENMYCYALCVLTDDGLYSLYGVRSSQTSAQIALDSFMLL